MRKDLEIQIESLIVPILEDYGFELVDLRYKKEGKGMALCVFIDKPGGISLDDCVLVSREVGAILEIEDPIQSSYRLEVSSPGLDRPLKKKADFERFAGNKVKIKTRHMCDPDQRGKPRKTFTGHLLGINNDVVHIELDDKVGGMAPFSLDDIEQANLVEEI